MTPISAGGGAGARDDAGNTAAAEPEGGAGVQLIINGIDRTLSYYLRPIGSAGELVVRHDASLGNGPGRQQRRLTRNQAQKPPCPLGYMYPGNSCSTVSVPGCLVS